MLVAAFVAIIYGVAAEGKSLEELCETPAEEPKATAKTVGRKKRTSRKVAPAEAS